MVIIFMRIFIIKGCEHMNNLDMKNIIVLKDLPSNIIDEAIVILKDNKIKKKDSVEETNMPYISTNIVEEAQNVIAEYIDKIEQPKKDKQKERELLLKYKKLRLFTILLGVMMVVSFLL